MKPASRLVAAALLLAGCTGNISFARVQMMAMVDDERNRYNLQAGLVNRACVGHALPADECQVAAEDGKEAVKQYTAIRKQLLAKESVDADAIIHWLLVIGSAVAHAYGIPVPVISAASPNAPKPATLPLMP